MKEKKTGNVLRDFYRLHTIYLVPPTSSNFSALFLALIFISPFPCRPLNVFVTPRPPICYQFLLQVSARRKIFSIRGNEREKESVWQIRIVENNFKWRTQNAGNQTQNVNGKGNRRLHTHTTDTRTHTRERKSPFECVGWCNLSAQKRNPNHFWWFILASNGHIKLHFILYDCSAHLIWWIKNFWI